MLLPFVRVVIGLLLVLTLGGFFAGVARTHMAILSFLCTGLLFSLSMFESEFNKVQSHRGDESVRFEPTSATTSKAAKTD